MIFFGYIIGTFIFAYLSAKHPIWLFPFILMTILIVVFSIYISNAYEDLLSGNVLSTTLNEFTIMTFIIIHLPLFISIVGIFGMVFSIVGIFVARRIFE